MLYSVLRYQTPVLHALVVGAPTEFTKCFVRSFSASTVVKLDLPQITTAVVRLRSPSHDPPRSLHLLVSGTPEPGTWILVATGCALLIRRREDV